MQNAETVETKTSLCWQKELKLKYRSKQNMGAENKKRSSITKDQRKKIIYTNYVFPCLSVCDSMILILLDKLNNT